MVMHQSMNLTPAESLMLLSPENAPEKKMIKLTFADLMLNGVIKSHIQEEKQFLFTRKRIYISREKSGSRLRLKPHEKVILDHLHKTERLDTLAKNFYQSVGSLKNYAQEYLRQPLYEQGYFQTEERKWLLFIPHTKFVLTEKGLQAQKRIKSLLEDGDNLESWVMSDPCRAKAYLSVCGPNVLLLEKFDLSVIEEWSRALAKEESKPYDHYDHLWYGSFRHVHISNDDDDLLHPDQIGILDCGDMDFGFNFDDIDFDILSSFDSFSDFDSALDSDLGGDGGDGGGDGGGD